MSQDKNSTQPTGVPGAPADSRGNDGFLSSLMDLESRIGAFKSMHEQAAARDMELSQRERGLAEREAALTARLATIERRAVEIVEREAAARVNESQIESRAKDQERAVAAKAAEIEWIAAEAGAKAKEHATRLVELERAEADLAEREKSLAVRAVRAEAELDRALKHEEEVELARAELDTALAEISKREHEVAEHASSIVREREVVEKERATVAEAMRAQQESLRSREQELHEGEFDLSVQRDELARERASVAEQARTLAEQMKARDEEQNAAIWSTRMEAMQIEIGQAKGERARVETELAQSRAEIESLTKELIEANQSRGVPAVEVAKRDQALADARANLEESRSATRMLQDRVDALEQEIAVAAAQRTRENTERDDQIAIHRERLAAHSKQLDEANHALARAAAEKSGMVTRAEHQRLEKELAAAKELLEQAEASSKDTVSAEEVRRREASIAGLEQALKEAEQAASEITHQEIESREAIIADLRAQLAEAATSRPSTEFGSESEEIAKRDEAITILTERLEHARAESAALRNRPRSEGETSVARSPEMELQRRERLKRYKSMLQAQARKIIAAQTALQRRHADCELVLTNRSRLSTLAQQLARAEKKLTSSKARSGAAAALLYMVATLGILAGLSWEVSKRIWPGTYVARAVIEADAGRRVPKAEDLAAWQKDHAEMLSDPRLVEMTAERMQQRGLVALGRPADLAARLKEDMYIQPAKPGALTVELRGEGAEKTALVLDTFVTSFKSFADQARDERSNDIGVTIAQAATAGTEPLMEKRLEHAGGVFGGAALAAGLAGLIIWTRLVRAKKKFDHAAAVEAALEEVDWGTLEASIKKHTGKEGAGTTA